MGNHGWKRVMQQYALVPTTQLPVTDLIVQGQRVVKRHIALAEKNKPANGKRAWMNSRR